MAQTKTLYKNNNLCFVPLFQQYTWQNQNLVNTKIYYLLDCFYLLIYLFIRFCIVCDKG